MTTPNIFRFAKSELSQDAVLAYMLVWAAPFFGHMKKDRAMHKLGKAFLLALLKSTRGGARKGMQFKKVIVETQDHDVDVSVKVNDSIFLILEDKVEGAEGVDKKGVSQIEKYVKAAKKRGEKGVRPIYIKTGNEKPETRMLTEKRCDKLNGGHFYRKDLLNLLSQHKDTGNAIVDEFHRHLENLEQETQSFLCTSVKGNRKDWRGRAEEGYCLALERDFGCEGWGYTSNPADGTYMCYYGNFRAVKNHNCDLYLQIDHSTELYLRVRGDDISIGNRRLVFEKVEKACSKFPEIRVEKCSGNTRGNSTKLAKVFFDKKKAKEDTTYMALDAGRKIDLPATVQRLKKVVRLIEASCK